ncbi:DinB family protein [Aquirufa beregesia]
MINQCILNLKDLKLLLEQLSEEQYRYQSKYLLGSSIGEHVRHILEFYEGILTNKSFVFVDYSKRERNKNIEINLELANDFIGYTMLSLASKNFENTLLQIQDTSISDQVFTSSFGRELYYCLEHSIHHQALIRVSLIEQNLSEIIKPTFGYANSTIQYQERTSCAQ